jgi:hypothetical protein
MTEIDDNHKSDDQDQTVHLDNQAQLHVLKVKARPETSTTKIIEYSQRRINIKTRSNQHQIHLKVEDNNKVNTQMDLPYQTKVISVRKQENKRLT